MVALRVWRPTLIAGDLVQDTEVDDVLIRVKAQVDLFKKLLHKRLIISVRLSDLLKQTGFEEGLHSGTSLRALAIVFLDGGLEFDERLIFVFIFLYFYIHFSLTALEVF